MIGLESTLGASADSNRIAAVLQSATVTDAAIERFDLKSRYREKYQENARDAVWKHCEVKAILKPNLVQLSCEDTDPQFVQQLLTYFTEIGNQAFRRVSVSTASEEVRFLEKRVSELREQAYVAADRMREFQEKYKIVDIDTQAKAVVSSLAALHAQRINKQLELEYAKTFSSSDEASLRQLESQLSVIGDTVHALEVPAIGTQPGAKAPRRPGPPASGTFPAALAVPKMREDFENLYRDRKVAEATLVFALERLEGARANAARDVSTFAILDPPTVPTRKSRPKRAAIMLLSAAAGALIALAFEWARHGGIRAVLDGDPVSPSDGDSGSSDSRIAV